MTLVLGLLASMVGLLPIVTGATAQAAGTQEDVQARLENTVYAYVQAGESLEVSGTDGAIGTVTAPDGQVATGAGTYGPATGDGVWLVELNSLGSNAGYVWTVDVVDDAGIVPGRAWTTVDRLIQDGGTAAMRDLEYWVVNDTGYIYSIELNGYNGVNSEILANSVGWADEDCAPTYASYEFDATGIGNNAPPLPDCGETYRIFYEKPAADLPAAAVSAAGEVTVAPPVLGEADLAVDDLAFTPTAPGTAAGTFTYSIDPRFTGGYRLEIDVDGNGSYGDAVDRAITLGADGRGAYSHEFDGLDGTGAAIADCTQMNARIHFDKLGEVHIVQHDVEGRAGGIEIVRLNGENSPDATIHWNDEGMPGESTTDTPLLVGESIDSTGGVHGWDYDTYGWGNGRYIDDWAYLPLDLGTGEIQFGGQCLTVEKTSSRTPDTRAGDTVEYTVTATNSGTADYTAAQPAVVLDDLTGVLDDATYNDDAEASRAGEVTYAEPILGWSGALAAGESVELTYSVELTSAGDGIVRNVAWTPGDPENPTPPECIDAPDGVDAVTGEACDDVEYPLPRLSIAKTADLDQASAVGETITYTIEVTNEGPGDYTATAPATFTDDLSGVLDAATYNQDAEASTGELTYDAPNLAWAGPLAAGESATVTYTATYTGEGDQHLLNTACVPASQAAPGFGPCDIVELPGSDLQSWKEVSASETPAVAGTVLTYTLHFRNDGAATATVDAVDDLTHVSDDADVTTEPASPDLSAVRDGDRIAITGTLAAGESTTVVYEVTLRADGDRGDDVAANFLLKPGEEPPTEPVCEPADEELPDCTITPVAAVSYAKSVEASASPVVAGTELTYTITVTNSGAATGKVSREDVLTDVLDDAELTGAPTSDTTSVIVSDVADGRFTISGELAGGASATVTYSVTVRPDAERGDHRADNFLVPPGQTPPETCEEGDECTSTLMPLIEATKSVAPESGTTVHPGDEVAYTLTFTNTGTARGEVDHTDHLAGVLDDAALTGGPKTSDAALTAELAADDTLVVTGNLDAGQTVTVTYTVTVAPDGRRADNVLANVLAPTDATDPDCEETGVSCTTNPVPLLESWKTVEADTSPVAAGTVLTYTLHFENSGAAAATVEHIDDLTHVLDDADVTSEPVSTDLAVNRTGERITIDGTVPVGQTRTVTYQVTVRPDGERGDDLAANFLLADDPQDPPAPPADPVCQPADHERPDCTVTPIGHLATVKSVSADSDPIGAGTILTFTLTFDNQGEGPVLVDHVDHLADVLDDAELTSAPVASDPALSVSEVVDDAFAITGELAAGRQVIVTYEVTINDETDRGDNLVMNALTPSSQEPPAECEEDDPNCTLTRLPLIEPAKTANPETGSGVQAGEEITYTLSFRNVGEAAGPVDHTDHLAEVLDDADLTGAPTTSDPALVASSGADGTIRVTGTLEPGQAATVAYTVTVRADGERGDNLLRNVVVPSRVTDPDCESAGAVCTEHPIGQIESWKTVDPSFGSTVRPGTEATYTLHFRNVGNAAADVAHDDLLGGVLDDAELTTEPLPSTDALIASGIDDARFTVTGTLAAGESATVSYTVTVRPDGERGDDRLENFLVPTGEEPPAGPCLPGDPERATCTVNPVAGGVPAPMPSTGASISAAALWSMLGLLAGGGALLLSRRHRGTDHAG